jgi:hypothetical protein
MDANFDKRKHLKLLFSSARTPPMSKGPGKIQKQLPEIFTKSGSAIFSTDDLCRAIFGVTQVDKSHRVSILRALKSLTKLEALNIYRAVLKGHRDDFWFNRDKAKSALNVFLHKAGARNIRIVPAKDRRPSKSDI